MPAIFFKATDSGWYPEFLKQVVAFISSNSANQHILDIGTGPGTLPQMLINKNSNLHITGIDINKAMIDEARKRLSHRNVTFQIQKINVPLEYADNQFDVVTYCSVLFLVDDEVKTFLIEEALRVVRPNGTIIVLTPSGLKSVWTSLIEVWRFPFSFFNFTYIIWKTVTTRSARKWNKTKWLAQFAEKHHLLYQSSLTFNDNAIMEIISIPN